MTSKRKNSTHKNNTQSHLNPAQTQPGSRPTHIVGIGASAGGLEALEQFFNAMPSETGLAFVVVQHLSPDFKSLMDELLAHRTKMPIHRVEDGMVVEANAVYLIPPKKEMIISEGRLLLTDKDPKQALTLPIDRFFRSLAQDVGRDAIAVVLSGTGSDGSRGIRDVHDAGGLVVVQSQESAKFDGMPKSALDTGIADFVLKPREMPAALLKYVRHPIAAALVDEQQHTDGATGIGKLFALLRSEYGIDFNHYKPSTVGRRIERRLLMHKVEDLDAYADRLASDSRELNALYKDLLIGVTKFFRDAEAFSRLETDVLPDLIRQIPSQGELRIWVPGCGTGEEAYSLAILVHECLEKLNRSVEVKIFATDVHRTSIDVASAGVYSEADLSEVTNERIHRYFTRKKNPYQVAQILRQMIVFAQHNVIKDAPFTKLDMISCRNLLIYLQPVAQKKVLSLFHFGLKTGGTLFLGPSENPTELGDEFDTVDVHWKIYSKRRDIRLPADLRLPMTPSATHLHSSALTISSRTARAWDGQLREVYDGLLDRFIPAGLLVDGRRELVHTFGGAEGYLSIKAGKTSTNVLDLVDANLRSVISGLLNRVENEQQEIQCGGVRFGENKRVSVTARPIPLRNSDSTFVLVTLEEERLPEAKEAATNPQQVDLELSARDRLEALETELRYTKENLQAAVEELEASNEELQAANEELVASNEELQSTNEELHSVNEELYTVNAEYQRKIVELTQLNNDMDNLLRSTEVGTIFLDRDLCIRKFTPQVSRLFNLMPQDVGRRIDAFTHNLSETNLVKQMERVLETAAPFEKEVQDRGGGWHILRILPYRSSTGATEGVVLTLIDVTTLKRAQADLQELDRQLVSILDNSKTFIAVKDLEGRYTLCNRAGAQILGSRSENIVGKADSEFFPTEVADQLGEHDQKVISTGRTEEFEESLPQPDGIHTYLSIKFPLRNEKSEIYGLGMVLSDITERKKSEVAQKRAVTRRDQFLAMLSHELRNPLGAILNATRVIDRSPQEDPKELLGVIHRQAHQMSRLLDDLLDVSRVTQGKIELRKQIIDVRNTTRDALDAVQGLVEQRKQTLYVELSSEPIFVEADPARLQQAQVNLLTNASKYNSDGGSIWVQVTRSGDEAVISIRDNGSGIAEDMREAIFELFVQSDAGKSDGGMGVGLTLARSIITKHGGSVSVRSAGINKGSEFTIHLPASKRPPNTELTQTQTALHASTGGLVIVLVEDNKDARETLASLLSLDGYRVIASPDGEEGIAAIETHHPELALVDIELPQLNGYEVAKRVRANPACRTTYLVALTGYGQSSDREAALSAGFDAHLVKPLDTVELDRLIRAKFSQTKN